MQREILQAETKKYKTIKCGNAQYLNEVIQELPKNVLFNKGITGAGGTTIALTDNYPTVICVPYTGLITNKTEQANSGNRLYQHHVFGVYSGITQQQLDSYLRTTEIPKIMVTYDSLAKLSEWINPVDYNILIDEYHCLFMAYSFRESACHIVLNNYKRFKNFTFMTATPVEDNFLLEELKDLDVIKAEWDNTQEVKVITVKGGKSVSKTTISTIRKFLEGRLEGNAYFFVNSVKIINEMIKNCGLSNETTRVIYSDHNTTALLNGISRGKTTDEPKKINFITSTAFEGCDIYDPDGKTIIISDNNKEHTLLDIQIQVSQIIGRIRNSRYKGCIYHIYANSKEYDGSKLSYDEYQDIVNAGLTNGKRLVDRYNNNPDDADFRTLMQDNVSNNSRSKLLGIEYIKQDSNGSLVLDKNRHLIALYNYRVVNTTYSTRESLGNAYNNANISVDKWHVDYSNFEVVPVGNFLSFKEACNFVKSIKVKSEAGIDLTIEEIQGELECYETYPFLKPAIEKLGFDEIEKEKYVTTNIRRRLVLVERIDSPDQQYEKIFKLLMLTGLFNKHKFVSLSEIKAALNAAYCQAGFSAKGITSSEIDRYFHTHERCPRIDGNRVKGLMIIEPKYKSY
jgi:hypothetical protein